MVDKKVNLLILLLIGSLFINGFLLTRMGNQVESRIQSQNSHLVNSMNRVNSEMNHLSSQLSDMKEKNKWVVSEKFVPNQENSSPEEISIDIEWSFRELENDAQVFLLYRSEGSEWNEVAAVKTGGISFRAPLALSPEKSYEYQFVSKGEMYRAVDPKKIPHHYYQPVPLSLRSIGSSSSNGRIQSYEVIMHQPGPVLFDFFKVKSVTALIYDQHKPVKEVQLESPGHPSKGGFWELEVQPFDDSITSIVIKTEYRDGRVHQEEVYPNEGKRKNSKDH